MLKTTSVSNLSLDLWLPHKDDYSLLKYTPQVQNTYYLPVHGSESAYVLAKAH